MRYEYMNSKGEIIRVERPGHTVFLDRHAWEDMENIWNTESDVIKIRIVRNEGMVPGYWCRRNQKGQWVLDL
jgi:hypothetical protein